MINATSTPLGEIADVVRGVTFSKTEAAMQPTTGFLPVIRAGNIQDCLLLDKDLVYIPSEKINAKQMLRSGDIIICTSSGSSEVIGKTAFVERDWEGSFGAFCAGIRANPKKCDPAYLFYYLRSRAFRSWTQRSSGVNIKNIRKSELDLFEVPLPPHSEQRRVASILDKADGIRRRHTEVIKLTDMLLKSIFLEMFGDSVSNPMGWSEERKLGEVSEIISGITKGRKLNDQKTREVPYLAVINVQDRYLRLDPLKTIEATEDEIRKYRLMLNDLLLTEGGDPDKLGRGTLWRCEVPECIYQNHVFRVRLHDETLNPVFLKWLVGSARGKAYFLKSAKQTTGIASINKTQLEGFPLFIPPIALQRQFEKVRKKVRTVENKIKVEAFVDNELFTSLSQHAFRGKL